jgi:hypothetical protein
MNLLQDKMENTLTRISHPPICFRHQVRKGYITGTGICVRIRPSKKRDENSQKNWDIIFSYGGYVQRKGLR